MVDQQKSFFTTSLQEVESPYLLSLIEQREGVIDERLQNLLYLEKYMRGLRPRGGQMLIRMMISGIAHAFPVEAEIMRRELETGQAVSPDERAELERHPPGPSEDFDVSISLRRRDRAKLRLQQGAIRLSRNTKRKNTDKG